MKNLFIIPARSGSKGIIDKNIQPINGIPLFVWSIIHAKYMSSSGDYICVSSDSDKYLSIAENWGADLIVVGSQGHGAFSRLVLGSVSQYLTTNAKCSVLIARDRNKK